MSAFSNELSRKSWDVDAPRRRNTPRLAPTAGVELDPCRAEDGENSFVSFTTCTDKRQNPACVLNLVCSKEGPHDGGWGGGGTSNCACASVERVSGGAVPLEYSIQ